MPCSLLQGHVYLFTLMLLITCCCHLTAELPASVHCLLKKQNAMIASALCDHLVLQDHLGNKIIKSNVQTQLKWLFSDICFKLNVRQPCIFQCYLLYVMFPVFGIEVQCIWTWMLFLKTTIIIILTIWNLEMKNAPAEFGDLPQKV